MYMHHSQISSNCRSYVCAGTTVRYLVTAGAICVAGTTVRYLVTAGAMCVGTTVRYLVTTGAMYVQGPQSDF